MVARYLHPAGSAAHCVSHMLAALFNRPSQLRGPKSGGKRALLWLLCALLAGLGMTMAQTQKKPAASKPEAKASTATGRKSAPYEKAEWRPRYYKGRSYVSLQAVASYYGFGSLDLSGKQISMSLSEPPIRFDATVGEKRVRLNGMVFYFSYPVISLSGQPAMLSSFDVANVLDPILRPKARRDPSVLKVVVLDPAGGGVETGARSSFGKEKDLTLDVARKMKPMLEGWGFTVILAREADEAVFPLERVRMANLIREEAIYISLRMQAGGAAARGIECSTLPPASTPPTFAPESAEVDKRFYPGNINDRESMALATTLQSHLIAATRSTDLGIKRIPSEEMRGIEMPAVVCRLGFLSHKEEGAKLATSDYRETMATAMARGVKKYADFLSSDFDKRHEEDAKRPLSFGRTQTTVLDANAGLPGERVIIRVPIRALPGQVIDRSKLEIQLFVYEIVNNIELELTVANPPKIEWLSVLPDWKGSETETFQAIYERPRLTAAEIERFGKRKYYGFVGRLIYDGKLLDETASPTNLNRSLYYFTPVFPRR
jgi:N-acetylmuramoyl-L-alanine amidase